MDARRDVWWSIVLEDCSVAKTALHSEKMLWTGSALGMVVVAAFIYGALKIVDYYKLEKVIPYTISAPNPPGDGRVLEKPSIKVRHFSLELLYNASANISRPIGSRFNGNPMLRPSYWRVPRSCQSRHTRRHRPRDREIPSRPAKMGTNNVYTTSASSAMHTSFYNGESGRYLQSCVFGFWEDYD
jgi:hypothetical protein